MTPRCTRTTSVRTITATWATTRRMLTLLLAAALLVAACGEADTGDTATTAAATVAKPSTTTATSAPMTSTAAATTTISTTTTATTATATTTTPPQPPDDADMEALAWGLLCRDLVTAGRSYVEAVAYWKAEGRPARMDADENGIPCQTVFPAQDVLAYWGYPLPTGLAPGPGSGWRPTSRKAPVGAACCSANHNGPESPPLPPESGPFPDDGAFELSVERQQGDTELQLKIRRWLPCSDRPDLCSPDLFPGDVYTDPDNSASRTVALDEALTVVITPIGRTIDGSWVDNAIEGNGAALAALLRRMDATVTMIAEPAYGAGQDIDSDFRAIGAADPTFPYGPTPGQEWFLSYRGPEDTYLTPGFYAVLSWKDIGRDEPSWMYDWWCSLEIIDGTPVLYIWAGQIAG